MKTIILYHKHCMDGLASAYVASKHISKSSKWVAIPVSYDDDLDKLLKVAGTDGSDKLLFVDFCPSVEWLQSSEASSLDITIIDHHEAAMSAVEKADNLSNVTTHFDKSECGATLTHKVLSPDEPLPQGLDYIKDRDLWQWKLKNSKEVSEALRLLVKPNDLQSFTEVIESDLDKLTYIGQLLLVSTTKRVNARMDDAKLVLINNTEVICLNSSVDQSELGNMLSDLYQKPSATYQINKDNKVWWSFRSLDLLEPVDTVAQSLGGNGHRNASGATTDIPTLLSILGSVNDK
jgi:oligoribonuclease NrnB/cAMP/cGMP phosphodiesterase (DHH superfamily)